MGILQETKDLSKRKGFLNPILKYMRYFIIMDVHIRSFGKWYIR